MADSEVVAIVQKFKVALAHRDANQTAELVRRWMAVDQTLSGQIEALATELAQLKAAGKSVSQWQVARLQRYQDLLGQMNLEMASYARFCSDVIAREQLTYGLTGMREARAALSAITGRLEGSFNLLPVSAVHAMVGLAGDGSPLLKLLKASWPAASQQLTQSLINGTALGWNPKKTALAMKEAMDGEGLGRAVTIARTEQLGVYRSSSVESYAASGIVSGWLRICARQARTCAACLMDDHHFYELKSAMYFHPNDRCSTIPYVKGYSEPSWKTGQEWFTEQPDDVQRQILGAGHFDAWKSGQFSLPALVQRSHDPTWGGSIGVKPLRDLLAA